jgi:flagellar motor protein MotB
MKFNSSRRLDSNVDEENPYWISFSDIMSGLLVIFILASLTLILELMETKQKIKVNIEEIARAEEVRRTVLREIQEELKQLNILVEVSDNESVLRIPEKLLSFESDRHRIPQNPQVKETVFQIGKVIYERIVIENRWQYLDTVFVEGHTDNRRSYRAMGNWGLSAYRAISVWNYWQENLPDDIRLESLINHTGRRLFSVSGYSDTRPATEQQLTSEDLRKNRRIDIRFTVKKPTKEDFERSYKIAGGQ